MQPPHPTRFVNGSVFTGIRSEPWVEALVINGSSVGVAGSLAEVIDYAPDAREVDLEGRTLLPGLVDAHNHFLATGESLGSIALQELKPTTKRALLDIVADAATTTAPGDVITISGFDPAKLSDGPPTRWELDAAAPSHRVVAYHVSGHGVLVNSAVFADVGLDDETPDPAGGSFSRDAAGRLTGLSMDAAMQLIVRSAVDIGAHGPNFHVRATQAQMLAAVDRAQTAFLAAGLTTVCDAQVTAREMATYQAADRASELLLRTVCMPLSHQLGEFGEIGLVGPFGGDRLRLGHMKFYADGSLIGHTALCSKPYGPTDDENGYLYRSEPEFAADVLEAYRQGWSVGVHAQGDLAIESALNAIERAEGAHPRNDSRPRVEHAGFPTNAQIARMSRMGVITVNQPSYLHEMGDQFVEDFKDDVHRLQPLRDELDAGVRVVLSSDSDVASYRPLHTVAAAMSRSTQAGTVIGQEQVLTLQDALFAHTIDAAFAVGGEQEFGSLASGMRSDLTIIDADLRATEPDAMRDLPVWSTVIDGVSVYGSLAIGS